MDVTSSHSFLFHLLTWVFKLLISLHLYASLCFKKKRNSCIFLLSCILLKLFHNFLLMVCSCDVTNCTNIVYYVSYSNFLCYNPSHHVFLVTRLHHCVWTWFNTFHSYFSLQCYALHQIWIFHITLFHFILLQLSHLLILFFQKSFVSIFCLNICVCLYHLFVVLMQLAFGFGVNKESWRCMVQEGNEEMYII
jgi:hypothetical protein